MSHYGPVPLLGTFFFLRERKSKIGANAGTSGKFGALMTVLIQNGEVFEARSTCVIKKKPIKTQTKRP